MVSTFDETPGFGEMTQKELSKRARQRKKLQKSVTYDHRLLGSISHRSLTFTDEQLACLLEQAKLAMGQASKLAGERMHYCGAMLRTMDDCLGSCESNPIYKEVNNE